mmetsp:Transcript_119354/g.254661  ORF Transcript_119354/g.254661 Transcript_119354/m.254661 type:complete len:208 (+) Transcript_119354:278-901(+)
MSRPLTDSLPCQGSCSHEISIKGGVHQGSGLGHVAHVVVACVRDFAVAAISEETTEELLATTVGYSAATQSHHQDGDPHGSEHCASAIGASLARRHRHGTGARHGTSLLWQRRLEGFAVPIAHGHGRGLPCWRRLRGCYIGLLSNILNRLSGNPRQGTGAARSRVHGKDPRRLRCEKAACISSCRRWGNWRLRCARWSQQRHSHEHQ